MSQHFMKMALLVLSVGFLGLTGCASKMSKSDCGTTDFYKMGLKDGQKGRGQEKFNEAQAQCQEQGVTVPADQYSYGRKVGLTEYCTESLAKKDARNGSPNELCKTEAVPPYLSAYDAELSKARADAERNLQNIQKSKGKIEAKESQAQEELKRLGAPAK
jgi:hypothetical protein